MAGGGSAKSVRIVTAFGPPACDTVRTMLPEGSVLDRAPSAHDLEGKSLEALRQTARQLERDGDWAAALMTYELVLLQTERADLEPDPRLFIKLGDLLVKTDCPGVAIGMFERAAARFAADGAHQSVIALGIKILRTDRRRQDVFVRFAKQLLEHGYVEAARLVLIDYAERAWARTALRTLRRLEQATTDETLRTLRRLIDGVEASLATNEMHGESVGPAAQRPATPQAYPDGAAASEKLDAPHDRAAVEAIRPRHRGLWSTIAKRPERTIEMVGVSSPWPRVMALVSGTAERLMRPDRALPGAVPVPPQQDGPTWLARFGSWFLGATRGAWSTLAPRLARGLTLRLPRWVPATLVVVTAGMLVAPPVYRIIRSDTPDPVPAEPIRTAAFTAPTPVIAETAPVHTGGGFLSVQDTAIAPLQWGAGIIEVPPMPAITTGMITYDSLTVTHQ